MERSVRQRRAEEAASLQLPEYKEHGGGWLRRLSRHRALLLLAVLVCAALLLWFRLGRQPPKLLVLSVSALRHDYLSKIPSRDAPFFTHFLRYGSRADWLNPTFPSGGLAAQASLFTGLYPERHGILGQHFMDRQLGELKVSGPAGHSADDAAWWAGTVPFWSSAARAGRRTAVINVHGGCVPFEGRQPAYCQAPANKDGFSDNLSRALDLLLNPEHGYSVAVVHTDVLRAEAETNGAESRRLLDELLTLDARLQQMDQTLMSRELRDKINIVIVSDGGLTDTADMNVVHIDQYLPHEVGVTITGNGAVCHVYTDEAHRDLVYGVLSNVPGAHAYRRHELPERYRLGHASRAPDVLLVADPDTFIENTAPLTVAAAGGYDDTEGNVPAMRGVLLARGPSFKHGVVVQPVHAVDVYPLLAALAGVPPEPNSGSPARTADMLRP